MTRWILPEEFDLYPDEGFEEGADPIPRSLIRVTWVPTGWITGLSSEPRDPSHDPFVRKVRREFRRGTPVPPITYTFRLPFKGDASDTHYDGAHRAHAARLEGLPEVPVGLVCLDRQLEDPIPPPENWEVLVYESLNPT